jgi:ribosomal protein L39E
MSKCKKQNRNIRSWKIVSKDLKRKKEGHRRTKPWQRKRLLI